MPDLDQAHRCLVDVLGCEYLYSLGPFRHDDSDWMATHLNVHPRAMMVENRWYRLGDQAVFEVFHYSAPDQHDMMPRNSDIGGHHVGLYVDDIDAAIEHLRAVGVRVSDGPTASKGPGGGQPLDLLPRAVGDAVRAGLLPGGESLGPRASTRQRVEA